MKKLILALGSLSLLALAACGDDTSTPAASTDAGSDHTAPFEASTPGDTGSTSHDSSTASGDTGTAGDTGGSEGGGGEASTAEGGPTLPAPPTLGTQIDRMGRPAINTALNHTFDGACTPTTCPAKDAYNADNSPANWSIYVPEFEKNLAIYDALDLNCGNQAGYGQLGNPAYATLASVLSNDALWVDTANGTCTEYLAVELAVLGSANTDCGGRTLTENVIDVTYNALAGTTGVSNGITAPASAPSTTFPYLATPH